MRVTVGAVAPPVLTHAEMRALHARCLCAVMYALSIAAIVNSSSSFISGARRISALSQVRGNPALSLRRADYRRLGYSIERTR